MSAIPHILSLGAGVQSSTLALMSAAGAITPMPVAAIFADTQGEPASVYQWLDWLETQLPFPVYRVTKGNLAADATRVHVSKRSGQTYIKLLVPAYVAQPGKRPALMGRRCTEDYKIKVLTRQYRTLGFVNTRRKDRQLIQWIGISRDEAHRMKPSRRSCIENRWPLIEADMTRADCLQWMTDHGYPAPPRSACVYCPFHGDQEWLRLQRDEPAEFTRAVEFERDLQRGAHQQTGTARLNGEVFLHSSLVPLDQVVFKEVPDRVQLDLFGNECEGLCGV